MTTRFENLSRTWDLDRWFAGGSSSKELAAYLDRLEGDLPAVQGYIAQANPESDASAWKDIVDRLQDVAFRLRNAGAFVSCLGAQDTDDERVPALRARVQQLSAGLATAFTLLEKKLLALPDNEWKALMDSGELAPVAFNLDESRRRAKEKLPADQEILANALSVDGYHAWGALYDQVAGKVRVEFEEDGEKRQLSAAQAANRLSSPDRALRRAVFEGWEEAWSEVAELCAAALNHLAGFRLNLYRARGWDDVLHEPLELNRMTRETLDAMWDTVSNNRHRLVRYLDRKKELLSIDRLAWYDQGAPVGDTELTLTFEEAAEFVVDNVGEVSPAMASLMTRAFEESWIESEDRANKRAGAFCTTAPALRESRVFTTFSGNIRNASTLAHELGHAFHQSVMNDLPVLAQRYAMNVAETASTFSEMVVSAATLRRAGSEKEKIALLARQLDGAVGLLMNIQARFLFETRFYEQRKRGVLTVDELNELMVEAQKEAFGGALDVYHPRFWASKLHFYRTGTPFYNFPYTFGYLFSAGVYAEAQRRGPDFESAYINLLQDTGRKRVEDLAQEHLGVDLTHPRFWQSAIDVATGGLEEFLQLTS